MDPCIYYAIWSLYPPPFLSLYLCIKDNMMLFSWGWDILYLMVCIDYISFVLIHDYDVNIDLIRLTCYDVVWLLPMPVLCFVLAIIWSPIVFLLCWFLVQIMYIRIMCIFLFALCKYASNKLQRFSSRLDFFLRSKFYFLLFLYLLFCFLC